MTAKDHKRKARPIGPATVTVHDGEIVVVVPDVLGKNESHKQAAWGKDKRGGRVVTRQTEMYRTSVRAGADAVRLEAHRTRPTAPHDQVLAQAVSGAWRLEVVGVWPTQNHDVGFVAPRGDADAAIPQALDALQHAGILDDDARVVEVRAWNLYRKGVRATVMRLVRVLPVCSLDADKPFGERLTERDAAIAHLLPLVPPAIEPPPKPAKSRRTMYQSIPVDARVRGRSAQMGEVVGPGTRKGFVCVRWDGAKHELQVLADVLEVVE